MASTSTGYNKTGIWKEQFSTDGQVQRWSSGSKAYFSVDSEIELESGSTMNVESGAVFNISGKQQIKSGGELELESGSTLNIEGGASINIATSGALRVPVSSGTTNVVDQKLPAYGMSILTASTKNTATTGGAGPLWTIRQPKGAGYLKTFLFASSSFHLYLHPMLPVVHPFSCAFLTCSTTFSSVSVGFGSLPFSGS